MEAFFEQIKNITGETHEIGETLNTGKSSPNPLQRGTYRFPPPAPSKGGQECASCHSRI